MPMKTLFLLKKFDNWTKERNINGQKRENLNASSHADITEAVLCTYTYHDGTFHISNIKKRLLPDSMEVKELAIIDITNMLSNLISKIRIRQLEKKRYNRRMDCKLYADIKSTKNCTLIKLIL